MKPLVVITVIIVCVNCGAHGNDRENTTNLVSSPSPSLSANAANKDIIITQDDVVQKGSTIFADSGNFQNSKTNKESIGKEKPISSLADKSPTSLPLENTTNSSNSINSSLPKPAPVELTTTPAKTNNSSVKNELNSASTATIATVKTTDPKIITPEIVETNNLNKGTVDDIHVNKQNETIANAEVNVSSIVNSAIKTTNSEPNSPNSTSTVASSSLSSSSSSSSTTTTTTTTTTSQPRKPSITYSVKDEPSILQNKKTLNDQGSKQSSSSSDGHLGVEEPIAQLSKEEILEVTPTNNRDYIIPIVVLIFATPMVLGLATVIIRRIKDYWVTRHYRRMDFLVDGMYND